MWNENHSFTYNYVKHSLIAEYHPPLTNHLKLGSLLSSDVKLEG